MKEGWEYKKLGDTLFFDKRFQGLSGCKQEKIVSFSHVSAEELKNLVDENGDVRLLSTGNFSGYTTKEKAGTSLNSGEVITIPTGGTANIKYYNGLFVDSGNIIGIASNASIVLRFIYYAMIANNDTINSYYRGASIKHPYMPDIYKIPIPIPSKHEQQHIVEELDLLSSIIEKKKAQLNGLDNLAQSLFYETFGDPITNEREWEVDVLENVVAKDCTISYGIVQPGDDVSDGIPVVRPVDLVTIFIEREGLKRVAKDISDSYKRTILKGGEILLCVRGTTGIMSFASSNLAGCNVTRGITPLAFGDKLNKYYAFRYLKTKHIQDIIADNTRGATLKQINMKDVRSLPMLIPPMDLQNQFASKIEAIEHQKELIKQSIKEVETLFNSRMDYYFN